MIQTFQLPSLSDYLKASKVGVIQLFKNKNFYSKLLRKAHIPTPVVSRSDIENLDEFNRRWIEENRDHISRSTKLQRLYYSYKISLNIICGSILQSAYIAIKLYSKQKTIPAELYDTVKSKKLGIFCIGRIECSIPIGLIIYAGRNQHTHLDEQDLVAKTNSNIFFKLATRGGKYETPLPDFDLNLRALQSYATNVVSLLGWETYQHYFCDLSEMLKIDAPD